MMRSKARTARQPRGESTRDASCSPAQTQPPRTVHRRAFRGGHPNRCTERTADPIWVIYEYAKGEGKIARSALKRFLPYGGASDAGWRSCKTLEASSSVLATPGNPRINRKTPGTLTFFVFKEFHLFQALSRFFLVL